MIYYMSEFAPLTKQMTKEILLLQKKSDVTLIFINDSFNKYETKLYFKQIMLELGIELPYLQVTSDEAKDYETQECYFPETSTVEIGYEDKAFSEHHIFDDITENIAKYIIKNEMFGCTKHMRLVFEAMSYKRFQHTMRVTYRMTQLIELNEELEPETAYLTALFHDIAKEQPRDDLEIIMSNQFQEYLDCPEPAWHGFVGAFELTQMDDEMSDDMYEAICFHTIGMPRMSDLGLALFVADYCDFRRPFDNDWQQVWEAAQTSLKAAAKIRLKQMETYLTENNKTPYWTTINMLEWLEKEGQ